MEVYLTKLDKSNFLFYNIKKKKKEVREMKYKLIKPINPTYSPIEQILTNRGIPYENIPKYLNTTDDDINPPEALGEEKMAAAASILIKAIQNNEKTTVVVDCDTDGYTSAALLINYLYKLLSLF